MKPSLITAAAIICFLSACGQDDNHPPITTTERVFNQCVSDAGYTQRNSWNGVDMAQAIKNCGEAARIVAAAEKQNVN